MRNIKLIVQYDGTAYAGFQVQPQARTVQGELEKHCAAICGHPVRIVGSGRTDAGTHAQGQVVNFRTEGTVPTDRIPAALNSLLPPDIVVRAAEEAPEGFDARRAARGKVYRYTILNRQMPSAFLRNLAWHVRRPLNLEAMIEAGACLLGEQEFSSFAAAGGEVGSKVRVLRRLDWTRSQDLLLCTLEASGFLYKMARALVGTLVEVGLGRLSPGRVAEILAARDRSAAGPTAPAHGLCLLRVIYE